MALYSGLVDKVLAHRKHVGKQPNKDGPKKPAGRKRWQQLMSVVKKNNEGNSSESAIPPLLRLLKQRRFDEITEILQFQKQKYLTTWLAGGEGSETTHDDATAGDSSSSATTTTTAIHALIEHSAPESLVDLMLSKLSEFRRGYMPEASVDINGQTPLHIAAQRGSAIAVVRRLTATSELPALTMDAWGRFPLHYACMNNTAPPGVRIDIVHHLLDIYPQAVMVQDCDGCTPMDYASQVRQHPRVILELTMVHKSMVLKRFAAKKPIPQVVNARPNFDGSSSDISTLGSIGVVTLSKRSPPEKPEPDGVRFAI